MVSLCELSGIRLASSITREAKIKIDDKYASNQKLIIQKVLLLINKVIK
jgi:hypothetical protein